MIFLRKMGKYLRYTPNFLNRLGKIGNRKSIFNKRVRENICKAKVFPKIPRAINHITHLTLFSVFVGFPCLYQEFQPHNPPYTFFRPSLPTFRHPYSLFSSSEISVESPKKLLRSLSNYGIVPSSQRKAGTIKHSLMRK